MQNQITLCQLTQLDKIKTNELNDSFVIKFAIKLFSFSNRLNVSVLYQLTHYILFHHKNVNRSWQSTNIMYNRNVRLMYTEKDPSDSTDDLITALQLGLSKANWVCHSVGRLTAQI